VDSVVELAAEPRRRKLTSGKPTSGKPWSVTQIPLRDGLSQGLDVVRVDNGTLSVQVLPQRGMGIWFAEYQESIPVGWNSPVAEPVHPMFVDQNDHGGLGWLSGFNELICRCGLASNGPPGKDPAGHGAAKQLTLHGRIANLPARDVWVEPPERDSGVITLQGVVDESMLFGPSLRLTSTLTTRVRGNSFTITDVVTNRGASPCESQLLYHTNIGGPFLSSGSKCVAAVSTVVPRDRRAAEGIATWDTYLGPTPGYAEQVYFFELLGDSDGQTVVLLRNAAGDRGVSMRYRLEQLPWFTLWKNTQATADGYCTGLEPGTNLPNFKTFERKRGRVRVLQPGESYTTQFEFAVHVGRDDVAEVEEAIVRLQGSKKPRVVKTPKSPWCAVK
jgi:hypothetical protein